MENEKPRESRCKRTIEPVFGIIKSVMVVRQFLTCGLTNVRNEWTLVCLAWNLKRMVVLRLPSGHVAGKAPISE